MNKKGTWTKEECRRYFVESEEELSLSELGRRSGYSRGTVQRWAVQDPSGDWRVQRTNYRASVIKATREKVVSARSDDLAAEISKAQKRHYQNYQIYSELGTIVGQIKLDLAKDIKVEIDQARADNNKEKISEALERLKELNAFDANVFAMIQDRAHKGEAAALGMAYFVNYNAALEKTRSMGQTVIELPEGVKEEDLQEWIDEYELGEESDASSGASSEKQEENN